MTPLQTFELFIRRANELEATRFLRSAPASGWGVTLGLPEGAVEVRKIVTPERITVEFYTPHLTQHERLGEMLQVRLPDLDDLYAFLLRFRRFVAQGDTLHLPKLYNLADTSISNGFTRDAFRKSRKRFDYYSKRNYPAAIKLNGKSLEPAQEYAVNLWMQGHVFHDNEVKRNQLDLDSMEEPLRNAVLIQFIQFAL